MGGRGESVGAGKAAEPPDATGTAATGAAALLSTSPSSCSKGSFSAAAEAGGGLRAGRGAGVDAGAAFDAAFASASAKIFNKSSSTGPGAAKARLADG